jgi:hypothetical protein
MTRRWVSRSNAVTLLRRDIEAQVEARKLREVLRAVLDGIRGAAAASGRVPSDVTHAAERKLEDAVEAGWRALGLSTCAQCGAPIPVGDDLCDRPECLASVPEVDDCPSCADPDAEVCGDACPFEPRGVKP